MACDIDDRWRGAKALITLSAVCYVGVLYTVLAAAASVVVRNVGDLPQIEKDGEAARGRARTAVGVHVLCKMCTIAIIVYCMRILVKRTPFPLDGWGGYDHKNLREINGGVVVAFVMFSMQPQLAQNIRYVLQGHDA